MKIPIFILITITLILTFVQANIFVTQQVVSLPLGITYGIATDNNGHIIVTSNAKVSIISVKNDVFETVRTDGPFRNVDGGYMPYYSPYLQRFIVYGRKRARLGRFSADIVGNFIDYEPSFRGTSSLFVTQGIITIGFVPEGDVFNGFLKIGQVTHIPRIDEPQITSDEVKGDTNFTIAHDGVPYKESHVSKVGQGAATVRVYNKNKKEEGTYLLFVIADHNFDGKPTGNDAYLKDSEEYKNKTKAHQFTFLEVFEFTDQNFHQIKLFYDKRWANKTQCYKDNKGYFILGNMLIYDEMHFYYNEETQFLFVMSQNTNIGGCTDKDSDNTPSVIVFKLGYENGTATVDYEIIKPPEFNYLEVTSTKSFGRSIDTMWDAERKELDIVIACPDCEVKHGTHYYSTGLVYHYKWTEESGFEFLMYSVPPSLPTKRDKSVADESSDGFLVGDIDTGSGSSSSSTNKTYSAIKFGNDITIYKDGKVRRVYILNSIDNGVYESIVPKCGDGILTTEVGEECEVILFSNATQTNDTSGSTSEEIIKHIKGCIPNLCICEDGYVADGLGGCKLKCERDNCNCDETNSCTSCNIKLMNISTRCQECDNTYEFLNGECREVCGNGLRSPKEECDGVANCGDNCVCMLGYVPAKDGKNACELSKQGGLIAWVVIQIVLTVGITATTLADIAIRRYKKKKARMSMSGGGSNSIYACGSTTKLDVFEDNEAERYPLYYFKNSPFVYSIAAEIQFFTEDDLEKPVEKLQLKQKYIFQIFVGNKSLNIASFAVGDPRLDKDDYDLEFTPDKGNLRSGDIICIYGKITPLRECAVKEKFTITVVNLNTSKSFVEIIPLEFSVED